MVTRVLVDASSIKPQQGGIRTYVIEVVRALSARTDLQVIIATSLSDAFDGMSLEIVPLPPATRSPLARAVWRELWLRRLVRDTNSDLLLIPVPEIPLRSLGVPVVAVVHDAGPVVDPALYSASKRLRVSAALRRTWRKADGVVCVSAFSATAMAHAFGDRRKPTRVIGEGPQQLPSTRPPKATPPYFLYVGSAYRHKNLETLFKALAGLDPSITLVAVGPEGSRSSFKELGVRYGLNGRIDAPGWVDPRTLADLYVGARAVVAPSLHEGFGLPVLEAMTAGVASVVSDIPAFREVAGDAALYVAEPSDVAGWGAALARVWTDHALRADLARRGRQRAQAFSWATVGADLTAFFQEVAEK